MISDDLDLFLREVFQRTIKDWMTEIRNPKLYDRQCDGCGLSVTVAFIPNAITTSPVGDKGYCQSCETVTTWERNELRRE
jgi:hypothetical protein